MPEAPTPPTPAPQTAPTTPTAPSSAVAASAVEPATVSFTLDGRPVSARPGEMLISAAERAGTFIPRFCYHPRMRSVGVCRMCLVEVSSPRGATLQPSCFVPVTDGMEVVTDSAKVKKAQDGVLEFLLVNHPLDCPVCDKGGECPLQDQTLAYGPGESRFVEEKRHFEKPIPISDLVLLDRERCIQCSRCTRFAEEVAGEALIDFAGRGEMVEVATFPGEPFSSYFSGNTVQICPVGALTATPYRFAARPWDLDQVESTCTTCALGCRVAVQSSANRLTRLLGIDSEPVNHGWLCDKGRFVFEAVNGRESGNEAAAVDGEAAVHQQLGTRLLEPMVQKNGELVAASWGEALAAAAEGIRAARNAGGTNAVAVLGGAQLTNEAAYLWAKLAKGVIGTDSVDAQLGDGLPAELLLSLPRATIDQTCAARTVILLSGDLREELPVLFLRLREAVLAGTTRLVELTPTPTSLTRYAAASLAVRPGDAPLVARALLGDDAAVTALGTHPEGPACTPEQIAAARSLVSGGDGSGGEGVVVVLGRPSMAEGGDVVGAAARVLAQGLPAASFLPALRRGNVLGALDMGLAPGLLPGRVSLEAGRSWFEAGWGAVPATRGEDTLGVLGALAGPASGSAANGPRAVVALGADVLDDVPDQSLARQALAAAPFTVAVTGHLTETVRQADVVLPAAVAHERPGTVTNIEGRVTRLGQKLVPPGFAWADWMIAAELAQALGSDLGVGSLAEIQDEMERLVPAYRGFVAAVVQTDRSADGAVMPLDHQAGPLPAAQPIDPIALPGVESVERQGAPPRVGLAESSAVPEPGAPALSATSGPATPPLILSFDPAVTVDAPHVAPPDSYSLRLVSSRRLYDQGSAVAASPSLTGLVADAVARANPYDLDRLGVTTGTPVRVRSPRGSLVLPAQADEQVARGVVAIDFNVPVPVDPSADFVSSGPGSSDGASVASRPSAAGLLIDAGSAVTEIRLESV